MTSEHKERTIESLGQFLKRTRIDQGFELEQIGEYTRISSSNLRAIEADDYGTLPADAFARGFYSIYAKRLNLDPEEIVSRYRTERGIIPKKGATVTHNPPSRKAAQISNMAEPASGSALSTIGYILLLLIILTGGICVYLDINPATFISEKLRSLQDDAVQGGNPVDESSNPSQPAGSGSNNTPGKQFTLPGAETLYLASRKSDLILKEKGLESPPEDICAS